MEESVQVYHLCENACELQRDGVAVDIMIGEVLQVVWSPASNKLHDQNPFLRLNDFGYSYIGSASALGCWKGINLRIYSEVRRFLKSSSARRAFLAS